MDIRADSTLELQLEQAAKRAVDQHVKEWIQQALAHMAKGTGRHRCGGAELAALLSEARQRAADYDEWHVVRLLQDSIDYAEGRILQPDCGSAWRSGIETRRASAIVLIGHPAAQPDVPEEAIYETIRTLNTHLARVEVLTYKELIDNAERSLGGTAETLMPF